MQAAAHPATRRLPLLRAQGRDANHHFFTASESEFCAEVAASTATAAADAESTERARSGTTRLVGLLGWPVAHSLSPRMQNAAFAALGLDWAYVAAADAARAARGGRARARRARLRGRERHDAAQAAPSPRSATTDAADSVNTLVVRDGGARGLGRPTRRCSTACRRSGRSSSAAAASAAAFIARARRTPRPFSRRGAWPPDVERRRPRRQRDARSATRCSSSSRPGQTLVDLPYPETATALARAARPACSRRRRPRGARRPGCGVVRALDGAAAPVDVHARTP